MSEPLLRVEHLRTYFYTEDSTVRAVDDVSFDIMPGETFALLGESGCGKSVTALSLLRLLPSAARIVSGEVYFKGEALFALPEFAMRKIRGKRIAMIFQEPMTSLNPVLTIGQQIGEVLRQHEHLTGANLQQRILELLNQVKIPEAKRRVNDYPFQLSGGMKQRVMIAMALACKPELLIADEPTTALDVSIQAQTLKLLGELQKDSGMAILLITHDLAVVSEVADRVAVMYAGEIVESAPRAEFFARPQHPYSQKLFASVPQMGVNQTQLAVIAGSVPKLDQEFTACRFANRCDVAWDLCREQVPRWTVLGQRQGVRCHLAEGGKSIQPLLRVDSSSSQGSALAATEPLLEVRNLKVYFPIYKGVFQKVVDHVKAVEDVSLTLARGQTLALVGESGSGKTTVGKAILQLIPITAGSIRFQDTELTTLTGEALRLKRRDMQIIFQDPYASLNPRMRVGEIIEEGMIALRVGENKAERREKVDALLEQVGLQPGVRNRYPHEFSGGQRQRIAIARALAVDPKLIICDEPTSALDVSVQAQILNLLRKLQQELGVSYLFITHNLAAVAYVAHFVAVMHQGRIVETGSTQEILSSPQQRYTQELLAAVPAIRAA